MKIRLLTSVLLIAFVASACAEAPQAFRTSELLGNVNDYVFTLSFPQSYVCIIDKNSHKIVGRIKTREAATDLAVASNGKLYVSIEGLHGEGRFVQVIDPSLQRVIKEIKVPPAPSRIVFTGGKVYVAHYIDVGDGSGFDLTAIDTATDEVIRSLKTQGMVNDMLPLGDQLLIALHGGRRGESGILILDSKSDKFEDFIELPSSVGAAPTRSMIVIGNKLYAPILPAATGDPNAPQPPQTQICIIDLELRKQIKTITVPEWPFSLAKVESTLYISHVNPYDGSGQYVSVLDTKSEEMISTIDVGMPPKCLLAVGTQIWVMSSHTINIIDHESCKVVDDFLVETPSPLWIMDTLIP